MSELLSHDGLPAEIAQPFDTECRYPDGHDRLIAKLGYTPPGKTIEDIEQYLDACWVACSEQMDEAYTRPRYETPDPLLIRDAFWLHSAQVYLNVDNVAACHYALEQCRQDAEHTDHYQQELEAYIEAFATAIAARAYERMRDLPHDQ